MAQPKVKAVHKFEGTIPDGDTSATVDIGATVDPEKTWVIMSHRCHGSGKAPDHMVAYDFVDDDTLSMFRFRGGGDVTCSFQLVEFEQGVKVQRRVFKSNLDGSQKATWGEKGFQIDPVDLDKTFLTLKVIAAKTENQGYDIVGEMWIRARFTSDDFILIDHNGNTAGDLPGHVHVYVQVVEFDQDVRVWSRDVDSINLGPFQTADILDELGLDDPPRVDQTFLTFNSRVQASIEGTSGRVDFWSQNGFLFNGSAALIDAEGDLGDTKDGHIFIVELGFAYIESYGMQAPIGPATEQAVQEQLGEIRDADNSVALMPWCNWGGFVDAGYGEGQKLFTTAEVIDDDTVEIKRGDGSATYLDVEVYVIEFEEPPLTASTGPLKLKEIYSGYEHFRDSDPNRREVSLPAAVDQTKTIIWSTSAGKDGLSDALSYVEFVSDDTIRVVTFGNDENTDVFWYLMEFESGVRVQRGVFGEGDYSAGHAQQRIDAVDTSRAFVIAQLAQDTPRPTVWLAGSRNVRSVVRHVGTSLSGPGIVWQVVEIDNDGEVFHYGKSFQAGSGITEAELALGDAWNQNSLFVWATDFLGTGEELQHFDVQPDADKVVVTRVNDAGRSGTVIEVADLGTFEGEVPMREHHLVEFVVGEEQVDVPLDHEYDPDRTVAWVPMNGNLLIPSDPIFFGGRANMASCAVWLEITGPSTLRVTRNDNVFTEDEDGKWAGYVYVLGFVPEPEGFVPEGPEGFYFGRLGGNDILKFGSTNRDG